MGHAIRTGDLCLARIDVSVPEFLIQVDNVPVELPSCRSPHEATVLREEIASSCLSLEAGIDQFHLEEEREEQEQLVIQVLDSENELDRSSGICIPKLVVAWVDDSLEEEEEMTLSRKKGLHELLADRAKGLVPKDASEIPTSPFSTPSSSSYC